MGKSKKPKRPLKKARPSRSRSLSSSLKALKPGTDHGTAESRKGRTYVEPGSIVAVPLPRGGWAHAIVTHTSTDRRRGARRVMLAVLDGVRSEVGSLPRSPAHAWRIVFQIPVHEAFIVDGSWPVASHLAQFDPSTWPLPRGVELHLTDGKWHEAIYDPETLATRMTRKAMPDAIAAKLPTLSPGWGAGAVPGLAEWAILQRWPGYWPHDHPTHKKLRSYSGE